MTDSAVRITHFPTGVVVTCQKERSQLSNRETAMKMLKSKLFEIELKKKEEEMKKIYEIRDSLFATKNWNYGNGSLKKNRKAEKYSCGVVEIGIDVENEKIKDISIEGDFFSELGIDNLCSILKGVQCSKEAIEEALKDIEIDRYIKSMNKEVFIDDIIKLF